MPSRFARFFNARTALDVMVLSLAYWLAFLFRFELQIPKVGLRAFLLSWPYVVVLQYSGLALFGVPRMAWRYVSMRDTVRITVAVAVMASLLVAFRLILPFAGVQVLPIIPLGVLAMDFVLAFLGLVAVRATWRLWSEKNARKKLVRDGEQQRVLMIGAGEAGVIVARELASRPDLGLIPVGFIDDNRTKVGTSIAGLQVLGTTEHVAEISEQRRVKRALITIANASGATIRRIAKQCRDAGLETKIIPGIHELFGDTLNLSRIREIAIEDLLGREPVHLDEAAIANTIRSRVVLITGAGGSIGAELCRQVCRFGPERLVLVERFENALFEIHRELTSAFPQVPIEPRVGDVCDRERMEQLFSLSRPAVVFHAAAHKHVPMMEWNPGEAVKNNVGGTRTVADLADRHGVERFVLISTDKAVNPSSVMGATKRVAEIYLQALSERSNTRFVTVRFGNVLGSAGSVVPIFQAQIAAGGPVTVTHPEMTRYFMTIPEASQLVLQAGAMGEGGEIFILDMGDPVRIIDLARDMIALSGLKPEDIEIKFSGVRAGEKLCEELSTDAEDADRTKHPKVFIGRIKPHEWNLVVAALGNLLATTASDDAEKVRAALAELIPEYSAARTTRASASNKLPAPPPN